MPLSCSSYSSSSIKEVDQEAMAMADEENSHVTVKGKRTKRPRSHPQSPAFPLSATSSSTSVSSLGGEVSGSSSTVVTEEEEDMAMANCLILLAQGQAPSVKDPLQQQQQQQPRNKFPYECKTCNKCFPTFQALGGHRASHKKPKMATDQEKRSPPAEDRDDLPAASTASLITKQITDLVPTMRSTKQIKLHECSICGLEFTSGQALGGHMRRHRPAPAPTEPAEENKEKSLLSLDLNLPAPEEADDDGGLLEFPSSTTQRQPILLVDCHY